MEELKPCCCGGAAKEIKNHYSSGHGYSDNEIGLQCASCNRKISFVDYEDFKEEDRMAKAVEAWNRRIAVSLPIPDVIAFSHEGTMPYITQWTGYLASGENKLYTAQSIRALLENHGISVID